MALIGINRPGRLILGSLETLTRSTRHAAIETNKRAVTTPDIARSPASRGRLLVAWKIAKESGCGSRSGYDLRQRAPLYASLVGQSKQSLPAVVICQRLIMRDTASLETAGRLALSLGPTAKAGAQRSGPNGEDPEGSSEPVA